MAAYLVTFVVDCRGLAEMMAPDRAWHGEAHARRRGDHLRAAHVLDLGAHEQVARGRRQLAGERAVGGDVDVEDRVIVGRAVLIEIDKAEDLDGQPLGLS